MNSQKSKNSLDSNDGGALKPRVSTATALKETEQPRSVAVVQQEALDGEIGRIDHEKLQPQGEDLVVQRRRDDLARLLIKIRRGEAGYALAKKFLDGNPGLPPETEV